MTISPHSIFCLSQAINQLREAAEFTEARSKMTLASWRMSLSSLGSGVKMTTNSQATTIALARRLAIADKRNQQAAIVQCSAKMLDGADDETKGSLMRLISATPAQRQEIVGLTERLILSA